MHTAIRVGIAGAGYWGSNLVRTCAELGILDVVCDADPATRDAVRRSYPSVEVVAHVDAMLARTIDAAIVATPAQTHAAVCLAALAAGKHVFVEKPLAMSVAEGERIAEAALAAQRLVFVGHLLFYHPGVRKLRTLLAQGEIGRVWHVRSRRLSLGKLREHENVWWSFAPHDLALMLAIMDEEPQSVVAAQTSSRGRLSDVAYADFSFSEGRSAHIEVCWLDPEKSARLDVFGEHGVLTFVDSRVGSSLTRKGFSVATDDLNRPFVSRGEEQSVAFGDEEPLKAEICAFVEAVRSGTPAETSARKGVAVLRALTMADQALKGGAALRALA